MKKRVLALGGVAALGLIASQNVKVERYATNTGELISKDGVEGVLLGKQNPEVEALTKFAASNVEFCLMGTAQQTASGSHFTLRDALSFTKEGDKIEASFASWDPLWDLQLKSSTESTEIDNGLVVLNGHPVIDWSLNQATIKSYHLMLQAYLEDNIDCGQVYVGEGSRPVSEDEKEQLLEVLENGF